MKRLLQIAATVTVCVVLGAGISAWSFYQAMQHVRPFYVDALAHDPVVLEQECRKFESQAGAFYSDAQDEGQWSAVFTAQQMNGWLATELEGDFAGILPSSIRDPRIAITPEALSVGFHSRRAGVEAVVTVDTELFITERGELAVRLASVRAGTLPLPAAQVAEEIRKTSSKWSLPLRWTQVDGDVIALVDIGDAVSSGDEAVVIQYLQLREGELFIAGETREPKKSHDAPEKGELERLPVVENPTTEEEMVPVALRPDEPHSEDHSTRQ